MGAAERLHARRALAPSCTPIPAGPAAAYLYAYPSRLFKVPGNSSRLIQSMSVSILESTVDAVREWLMPVDSGVESPWNVACWDAPRHAPLC